jgi:hypothetical protein
MMVFADIAPHTGLNWFVILCDNTVAPQIAWRPRYRSRRRSPAPSLLLIPTFLDLARRVSANTAAHDPENPLLIAAP